MSTPRTSTIAKGDSPMFTRVVECNIRPGKTNEFTTVVRDQIPPILQKQSGFVDETLLVSTNDPEQVLGLSFWRNREDAERYSRQQDPRIASILPQVLTHDHTVRPLDVTHYVSYKIAPCKA